MKKEEKYKELLEELLTYGIGEQYKEIIRGTLEGGANMEPNTYKVLVTFYVEANSPAEAVAELITVANQNDLEELTEDMMEVVLHY